MEVEREKTAAQKLCEYLELRCHNKSAIARAAKIPVKSFFAMLSGAQKMETEVLKAVCRVIDRPPSMFMDD